MFDNVFEQAQRHVWVCVYCVPNCNSEYCARKTFSFLPIISLKAFPRLQEDNNIAWDDEVDAAFDTDTEEDIKNSELSICSTAQQQVTQQ